MKQAISALLLLILSNIGYCQGITVTGSPTNTVWNKGSSVIDTIQVLPLTDTIFPTFYPVSLRKTGAMIIKNSNKTPYFFNGTKWISFSIITGSGFVQFSDSVTTFVTPTMLNDTASVLRGLIPTVPTIYYQNVKRNNVSNTQQPTLDFSTQFGVSNNIANNATDITVSALAQSVVTGLTDSLNTRVRYVDTSGMLGNYATKNGSNATGTWGINITGNSATTTTNANLTGVVTSVGNATSFATSPAFTGNVTITNTTDITLGSESALRVGGAANSTNITMGEYNSALGIQARNNGASANLFLQGDGGGVAVGNGALTGQRIFAVNNTGAGTGDYASIEVRNGSAGTDAIRLYMMGANWTPSGIFQPDYGTLATGTGVSGMAIGTQANVPFEIWTNNTKRWVLDGSGNTIITGKFTSSGGGIGYSTGAGGTVTQITSRVTGVTLNKLCGNITMFSSAVAINAVSTFTLTNSFIEATDFVLVQHISATNGGAWGISVVAGAGSCTITVRNNTTASITEATPLRFTIIKGVTN